MVAEYEGDSSLRWSPVAVLAAGPEADFSSAVAALGGAGGTLSDASAIVEDGRMHVSASGICITDIDNRHPPIVLTCAAIVAPFLKRQPALGMRTAKERTLRAAIDAALVPTAELFVIFPSGEQQTTPEGHLSSSALAASVAACIPLPEAEVSFERLQASLGSPPMPTAAVGTTVSQGSTVAWVPPTVGSLGIAVLHVLLEADGPSLPIGQPFPAATFAASSAAAVSTVGRAVRLCASPFGCLKPSLFLNAETSGTIAGSAAGDALILLDARCLPGSEGGAIVLEPSARAGGELSLPVALVGPSLKRRDGERLTIGVGLPFHSLGRTFMRGLPSYLLEPVLGPGLARIVSRTFQDETVSLIPSSPSTGSHEVNMSGPLNRHLCVLTTLDGSAIAGALVLSADGHVLVSASFAVHVVARYGKTFQCNVLTPGSSAGSKSVTLQARHLHTFEGVLDAALLQLQLDTGDLSDLVPLPWCFPEHRPDMDAPILGSSLRGPSVLQNSSTFEVGVEVWSLHLQTSFPPDLIRASQYISRGLINRVATERKAWSPVVLQSSFPSSLGDGAVSALGSGGGQALIHPGPPAALVGMPMVGTAEQISGVVLPHSHLALGTSQLTALLCLLQDSRAVGTESAFPAGRAATGAALSVAALPAAGVHRAEASKSDALAEVVQVDKDWCSRIARGSSQMLWELEVDAQQSPGKRSALQRQQRSSL